MHQESDTESLVYSVVGAFFEVHNTLGFGFLEHHYLTALEWELRERGHSVGREVGIPVRYKHVDLGHLRLDMIVDDQLVVEAKSSALLPSHASRQIFNYLRASGMNAGLLLHFGPKPIFYRVHNRMKSMLTHSEDAY